MCHDKVKQIRRIEKKMVLRIKAAANGITLALNKACLVFPTLFFPLSLFSFLLQGNHYTYTTHTTRHAPRFLLSHQHSIPLELALTPLQPMAFRFNWPEFDAAFYDEARSQLEAALNKGNKPKNIVDHITVKELHMGTSVSR